MGKIMQRIKAEGRNVTTRQYVREWFNKLGKDKRATAAELEVSINTINSHLRPTVHQPKPYTLTESKARKFARLAPRLPLSDIAKEIEEDYFALRRWALRNGWRARKTFDGTALVWRWHKEQTTHASV